MSRVTAPSPARRGRLDGIVRRTADIAASAVLLVVLAPLMLVLALAVRLSSQGPALFRQERAGLGGRTFALLKFRSMHDASTGPAVTAAGDARVTRVGRFLRRTKLDELPQLLNVLRGEMSLVGPRPEVPRYVAHYTREQRQVLCVRPGITGPTQLIYRDEERLLAGAVDPEALYLNDVMPAKLALDLRYVRGRTLGGDLAVLLRTVAAVICPGPRAGAARGAVHAASELTRPGRARRPRRSRRPQ